MASKSATLRGLALASSLILVPWVGITLANRSARSELDREVQAIKALGLPTGAGDLARDVPAAENAAPLYVKAIAELKRVGSTPPMVSQSQYLERFATPDDPEYAPWVASHKATLELLEQAAAKPACAFPRDWSQGAFLQLPELSDLRWCVKLSIGAATLAASKRDFDQAFRWLRLARSISDHLVEQVFISHLTHFSLEANLMQELQRMIDRYGGDARFRQKARRFVQEMGPVPTFDAGIRGELALNCITFDSIRKGRLSWRDVGLYAGLETDTERAALLLNLRSTSDRLQARVLRHFREAISAYQRAPTREIMQRDLDKLSTSLEGSSAAIDKLALLLVFDLSWAANYSWGGEAARRLTRSQLELWETRSQTGSFPAALDGKAPWNVDPYSDKPLVYRRAQDKFVLYSVGRNGVDDGGRIEGVKTDDIYIRTPTPKAK